MSEILLNVMIKINVVMVEYNCCSWTKNMKKKRLNRGREETVSTLNLVDFNITRINALKLDYKGHFPSLGGYKVLKKKEYDVE